MDPSLQELIAEGAPDDEVAVLLRLAGPTAVPPNVRLVAQFGTVATCRVPRGELAAVWASASVRSVKAPRLYGPSLDDEPLGGESLDNEPLGAPAFGDDVGDEEAEDAAAPLPSDVRRPPDPALPTGRGVVVAHIDWGVDIAHPDFRLPDGRTRLLALWDQRGAAFPDRPNRYGYGRIFTREEIDQALRAPDPYRALGYDPPDFDTGRGTHGAHTLSIAAGNGRGSGPIGIAPEALLCFVHLSTYTAEGPTDLGDSVAYIEAVDFILRTAFAAGAAPGAERGPSSGLPRRLHTALGAAAADAKAARELPARCVVINSSLGRHGGPHLGRTLVEQGLDAALREAPGRAFIHSAGNYYNRRTHASGLLRPGEAHTVHILVGPRGARGARGDPLGHWLDSSSGGALGSAGPARSTTEVEIWYPGTDRLAVTVTAPDGTRFDPVRGAQHLSLRLPAEGGGEPREIGRLYHRLDDPNTHDNEAMLVLTESAPAGVYAITLDGEDVADGRYHLWIERNTAGRHLQAEFDPADSRTDCTTGTICNGFRTIAVGAYDAHAWHRAGDVPDAGRPLPPFSSSGPTRDGRQKPDLCAPGVRVLAARSRPRDWPGRVDGDPPPMATRMSGTSMAAPHVTGAVALIFEAAGRPLAIEETRRLLLASTDPPPEAASDAARRRIGSGFLNVAAAVEAAAAARARPALHALLHAPLHAPLEARHTMSPSDAHEPFDTALADAGAESVGVYPEYDADAAGDTMSATTVAASAEALGSAYEGAPEAFAWNGTPRSNGTSPSPTVYPGDGEDTGEDTGEDVGEDVGEAAGDDRARTRPASRFGRSSNPSLSIGFVVPLGGSGGIAPALTFPVGGSGSPLAIAVPFGAAPPAPGTPPAPGAAPATGMPNVGSSAPAPAPAGTTAGMFDAPVVVADPDAESFPAGGSDKSSTSSALLPAAILLASGTFSAAAPPGAAGVAAAPAAEPADADETDEAFGERLADVGDALARDSRVRDERPSRLLAAMLDAVGQGGMLSPLGAEGRHRPSPTELYNAFVHPGSSSDPRRQLRAHYAGCLLPVALPGAALRADALRPGDLVIRVARGERWGQVSVVAEPRLVGAAELGGVAAGRNLPGSYLPVIEYGPVPHPRADRFARRVADARGAVLPDTLVLRVRRPGAEAPAEWAEEDGTAAARPNGARTAVSPPVLARDATGAGVRRLQTALNRWSAAEAAVGRPPLDGYPLRVDGRFGASTEDAVRDFHMRQFPEDAAQWTGVAGPATWRQLDGGRNAAAGTSGVDAAPVVVAGEPTGVDAPGAGGPGTEVPGVVLPPGASPIPAAPRGVAARRRMPAPADAEPAVESAVESAEAIVHTADLSDGFFAAMHAVAATLRTQPEYLLGVMASESGIRASAHNPNGHASGLIQFMPDTLRRLGWTAGHEAFRQLTAEEQMPWVERYLLPFMRQGLNSTARLYQATFLPATLGRGSEPDTVLVDVNRNDNAFAYAPNRGLDRRGDGRIVVSDLTAFVNRARRTARYQEAAERLTAGLVGPVTPPAPVPTPVPPAPPAPPPVTHPVLRRGARGTSVGEAQTKLNVVHARVVAQGHAGLRDAPLEVDGIFGGHTFNAVVAFQQLAFPGDPSAWDGVVGPMTWAQLDASAGVFASGTLASEPREWAEAGYEEALTSADAPHVARVRRVQAMLNQLTGAGLVEDGQAGRRTRAAIRAFQASHGLMADGVAGPKTEAALRDALARRGGGAAQAGGAAVCTGLAAREVIDHFDFGSAAVLPRHQPQIDNVAACVAASRGGANAIDRIRLVGHTDPVGTGTANDTLGRQRAEAIRDALRAALVARSVPTGAVTFTVETRGERDVLPGDPALSRRVELFPPRAFTPTVAAATLEIVLDDDGDHRVDARAPVATFVRMGLWNHAYNDPAGDLRNGEAEADNFVGSERRRFYFRVTDPGATGSTVTIDWRTLRADGRTNDDAPASQAITLRETPSGSHVYVSRAVMLVTDETDANQQTHSGLPIPFADAGLRRRGQSNHRLRRARMDGFVFAEYRPASGAAATVRLPLFQRTPDDERRRVKVRVINYGTHATAAYIAAQFTNASDRWNQVGVAIEALATTNRPIPPGALDGSGLYPHDPDGPHERATVNDLLPLTPDNTVTAVFIPLTGANAYATTAQRTTIALGDRYFIFIDTALDLNNYTLAHELAHVLFNRFDGTTARRFYTLQSTPATAFGVPLPDPRIRRRIQDLHSPDPDNDAARDNIINWVRRVRGARFPIGGSLGAPTATTGNKLLEAF